jgi:hypothetical protein
MSLSRDPYLTRFRLNKLIKRNPALLSSCYSNKKAESVANFVSYAADNLEGNLAECGVYEAGGTIIMAQVLQQKKSAKHIFAFDTFEGMPEPTEYDKMHNGDIFYARGRLHDTSLKLVQAKAKHFRVEHIITFVKGFFQDTIPRTITADDRFSLIVIDPDQYAGTKFCLEFFYPKVVPGGVIIIDDYFIPELEKLDTPGVKIAVDEFLADKAEKPQHLADSMYYFSKK